MPRTTLNDTAVLSGDMFTYVNGSLIAQSSHQSQFVNTQRTTVNTPGFGRMNRVTSQTKNLPMNPFSFQRVRYQRASGTVRIATTSVSLYSGILYDTWGGADPIPWEPTGDELARMRDQVTMKLLDKLKNERVNLAQVFAERKMTVDLIASTATRLAASIKAVKRGNLRQAANALGVKVSQRKVRAFNRQWPRDQGQAVSRGILELQYGWRPLLQDIYGSAEYLAAKQSRELRNVVRSRQTLKHTDYRVTPIISYGNNLYDQYLAEDAQFDYSGVIWFSTTGLELASVKEAGLTNPAELAWELTPYSFVVDWFIPIGNYISSLDATLGLSFEKGAYTRFLRSNSTARCLAFNRLVAGGRVDANFKGAGEKISCVREVLPNFPSSVFPSFKNPLSFEHAINAVALLFQAFSSPITKRYR